MFRPWCAAAGERAQTRFWEFFVTNIRNPNTRRAYGRAIGEFLAWCERHGVASIADDAAAACRRLRRSADAQAHARRPPSSAWRRSASVRLAGHRPDHADQSRRAPCAGRVTSCGAARRRCSTRRRRGSSSTRSTPRPIIGLRDRALIGLMVYSFARIGAALAMRVEDVYVQNRRLWVRLHEKGGKRHAMPCHHNLEAYLHAYIDGAGWRRSRRRFCSTPTAAGPASSPATPCPKPTPMR